jgi:membrane-anchored mycosin MYCP
VGELTKSLGDGSQPVEFNKNELVVALAAVSLVIEKLKELGIEAECRDKDETLELALLEFTGLDDWPVPTGYQPTGADKQDKYDQLIDCLRQRFADSCAHWTPAMAKNRLVGSAGVANGVVSGGVASYLGTGVASYIGTRGAGDPEPVLAGSANYSVGPKNAGEHCRIAILDTRLTDRPQLLGKVVASSDSYLQANGTEGLDYGEGHATFVAGLIVKEAPGATLHAEAVLTGNNSTCTAWDLAKAMARLADSDIDVLNLSLGCFTRDDQPPFVLQRAVELLRPRTVIIAAAGNHGDGADSEAASIKGEPRPFWPAALDTVIAVGATDGDHTAKFSPKAVWVNLEAPGVDVMSLYLSGPVDGEERDADGKYTGRKESLGTFEGYARWSGTSAATATVTGMVAAAMKGGRTAAQAVHEVRARTTGPVRQYRPS